MFSKTFQIFANLFSLYFLYFKLLISLSFVCSQTFLFVGLDYTITANERHTALFEFLV